MLLISIVDPSEDDTAALQSTLQQYFTAADTAFAVKTFRSGMEFIRSSENSDIVFLNIRLDKLDGLETARILRKLGSEAQLIFTAKDAEHAIHGYEVDALDYLLKPLGYSQIAFALDKAIKRLSHRSGISLALKLSNGTASISADDITYVEVFDHNLVYHTIKGEYNVRGKLSDVYEKLDKDRFLICNRSFIVNLRHISGIWSDHVIVGQTKIAVSKSHRKDILSRFSAYLNGKERVK